MKNYLIDEFFFFLFLIRTSVKTTFVFWLKQIPVLYLFVAPTVSNPSAEPTQQSEKRPKLTRKTTRIPQHNLRQELTDRKIRLKRSKLRQCSHYLLTMEFYDWNTNFQALVFVLLTLATTPQRFSQVNKHFFLTFSCRLLHPNICSNWHFNCSNVLDLKKFQ